MHRPAFLWRLSEGNQHRHIEPPKCGQMRVETIAAGNRAVASNPACRPAATPIIFDQKLDGRIATAILGNTGTGEKHDS
jgi:hypothetical protein